MGRVAKYWRTGRPRQRRGGIPRWLTLMFAMAAPLGAMGVVVGNASPAAADTGGYPYYNMPCVVPPYGTTGTGYWCSGYNWGTIPNNTSNASELSPYGYDYRNCTDYVAWKLSTLGVQPAQYKGLGNADTWGSNAASHGLVDNGSPKVGSVAVSTAGTFGHVAFVTAVNGTNITVSQYNYGEDGNYSVQSGTAAGLGFSSFVHFEQYESGGGGGSPSITSVTPGESPIGTPVTIGGSGLANASSVSFNGVPATVSGDTASTITTTVPSGATTGNIVVTTAYGTASVAFIVDDGASEETPTTVLNQASNFSLSLIRGPNNSLDAYWDTIGQPWAGPAVIGGAGSTYSAPSVVLNQSSDFALVMVQGPNNSLDAYWDTIGQPWAGPATVGGAGSTFSAPDMVLNQSTGFISASVQGPNNSLQNYWDTIGQPWAGPATVGGAGSTFSAPDMVLNQSTGFISASVQGPNNSLQNYWVTIGQPWAGPATVGGAGSTYAVVGAVLDLASDQVFVLSQGPSNTLEVDWVTIGQPWAGPDTIGGPGSTYVATPPTTSVLVPSNGATLSGSTTLDASASNATSVEFWLLGGSYGFSGHLVGTATATIYGWLDSWNTTTVPNGTYLLLSEAFGAGGSTFSSAVSITVTNNLPPTTSVIIPSNGATLSGTTTLDASASNATSVEFRLFGGSYGLNAPVICTASPTYYGWLCNWNTTTVPNGTYFLASEAFGAGGSAFSSGVSVTVKN
jgi:surface antigen